MRLINTIKTDVRHRHYSARAWTLLKIDVKLYPWAGEHRGTIHGQPVSLQWLVDDCLWSVLPQTSSFTPHSQLQLQEDKKISCKNCPLLPSPAKMQKAHNATNEVRCYETTLARKDGFSSKPNGGIDLWFLPTSSKASPWRRTFRFLGMDHTLGHDGDLWLVSRSWEIEGLALLVRMRLLGICRLCWGMVMVLFFLVYSFTFPWSPGSGW
jgi:hypothetical protein